MIKMQQRVQYSIIRCQALCRGFLFSTIVICSSAGRGPSGWRKRCVCHTIREARQPDTLGAHGCPPAPLQTTGPHRMARASCTALWARPQQIPDKLAPLEGMPGNILIALNLCFVVRSNTVRSPRTPACSLQIWGSDVAEGSLQLAHREHCS